MRLRRRVGRGLESELKSVSEGKTGKSRRLLFVETSSSRCSRRDREMSLVRFGRRKKKILERGRKENE